MDCERLDAMAIDLVYDELDRRAAEEAEQHLIGCVRCAAVVERLRGGLRAADALPMESPSSLLEARILSTAPSARVLAPWPKRTMRAVATAGRWAMRPQIAMAAVLVMMVGTSALILGRSSSNARRTRVTDEGTPVVSLEPQKPEGAPAAMLRREEPAKQSRAAAKVDGAASASQPGASADDHAAGPAKAEAEKKMDDKDQDVAPQMASPPPPSAGKGAESIGSTSVYDDAMTAYTSAKYADAAKGFDAAVAAGQRSSSALLYAARSQRALGSCREALPRFQKVVSLYAASSDAPYAALEGGECARSLGDPQTARALFAKARESSVTKARAESNLAAMDAPVSSATPTATATVMPMPMAKSKVNELR